MAVSTGTLGSRGDDGDPDSLGEEEEVRRQVLDDVLGDQRV